LLRQAEEQEKALAEGRAPEDVSTGKAVTAAVGSTALDLVAGPVFKPLFRMLPFMKPLLGEAGEKAAREAGEAIADAASKGTLTYSKGIAKGVGKGTAFEVPQEVAQQALERWQAGLDLTDAEAREEYAQAAIGAAVLGGTIGGVSGAVGTARERAKTAREEEERVPPAQEQGEEIIENPFAADPLLEREYITVARERARDMRKANPDMGVAEAF
jgi:hypothetical protein